MHHIYKTRAIILNSNNLKEADKYLVLLTEDFGLVTVIAQGTRKNESKLRQSIQDYSVSEVALVNGRTGWRLTNAKIDYSISAKIENNNLKNVVIRTLKLVERLVLGESDDELFSLVVKFSNFAIENQHQILHEDQIKNFESLFVLGILQKLGYVGEKDSPEIINQELSMELINTILESQRKKLNRIINQSIRESDL